jgi:hypothetical protein
VLLVINVVSSASRALPLLAQFRTYRCVAPLADQLADPRRGAARGGELRESSELLRRDGAMLVCRSQLLNESCDPPGYRWRKPAFLTMSEGRNGTPCHDRQAPGALDLIAAVQQGDKIIMTFEETMTKLWFCALAVHPYAEICPSAFLRRLFAIISAMRSR